MADADTIDETGEDGKDEDDEELILTLEEMNVGGESSMLDEDAGGESIDSILRVTLVMGIFLTTGELMLRLLLLLLMQSIVNCYKFQIGKF